MAHINLVLLVYDKQCQCRPSPWHFNLFYQHFISSCGKLESVYLGEATTATRAVLDCYLFLPECASVFHVLKQWFSDFKWAQCLEECVCVCACVHACVRACVHACMHAMLMHGIAQGGWHKVTNIIRKSGPKGWLGKLLCCTGESNLHLHCTSLLFKSGSLPTELSHTEKIL